MAASLYGRPRSTHGADLVIDPTPVQIDQLVDALAAHGFYASQDSGRSALRRRSQFNVVEIASASKIDLIIRKDRPFSVEEFGPLYRFTPAVSFFISCKDQKEVDYYWNRLLKGGKPGRCGWLVDRFGLSWQVVPDALGKCLAGKDRAGAARTLEAMMQMVKLDVKKLKAAYKNA